MNKFCEFGFNGTNCNPSCQNGATFCIPTAEDPNKCMLRKCINEQWQDVRVCQFGYDGQMSRCTDPCDICVLDDNISQCPYSLYDTLSQTMYQCSPESGWIQGICANDFTQDNTIKLKDDIDINRLLDPGLTLNEKLVQSNLVYGHCGECSDAGSPSFCSADKKYIYHCKNGQYVINNQPNETCTFKDACTDAYGDIYVDTETNRYHCGTCNHACGATQSCIEGKCVSTITKEDCTDHYARVQLGSRWVQAYCIESMDELKKVGTIENNENAYILVDDIDITGNWKPLDKFEQGIFLGNSKTITIHSFTADNSKPVGLFTEIGNAYFDDLHLVYEPSNSSPFDADTFGLLAGKANHSTIRDIVIEGEIHLGKTVVAGGIFGRAENDVIINGVTHGIHLYADNKEAGRSDDKITGIGGLVGIAENIQEISHIKPLNPQAPILMEGVYNIGGFVGLIRHTLDNSHKILISNVDVPDNVKFSFELSGNFNVGGLVGRIITTQDASLTTQIEHFDIEQVKLSINDTKDDIPQGTSTEEIFRNFGGLLGAAHYINNSAKSLKTDFTIINNIQMAKIEFYTPNQIEEQLSTNLGGITGYAENLTFHDLHVGAFDGGDHSRFVLNVGGIVGSAINTNIQKSSVDTFYFKSNPEKCYQIGGLSGDVKTVNIYDCQVGLKNDLDNIIIECNYNLAGMVGRASENSNFENVRVYGTHIVAYKTTGGLICNARDVNVRQAEVWNNYLASTREIDFSSNSIHPVGGLIGMINNDVLVADSVAHSKLLTGFGGVGGLFGCNEGAAVILHSKAFSTIKTMKNFSGFGGTCAGAQSLIIKHSIAESNILGERYGAGFSAYISPNANVSYSAAYTNIYTNNIYPEISKQFSGFVFALQVPSKIFASTSIANIVSSRYTSKERIGISAAPFVYNYTESNSGSFLLDAVTTNIDDPEMEGKMIYNSSLAYIDCPCCRSNTNNCICEDYNDIEYETKEISPQKSYQCVKGGAGSNFKYSSVCYNEETGYLSPMTSFIRNPQLKDDENLAFYPHVYINDEPDWHTADRAEYRCVCRTETPTDDPENPVVTEDEYFTLEPMDNPICTCDPMWFELTCDVERFKTAIGCEGDKCDGLVNKLRRQKQAPDGKFLHDVPISPVTDPDTVCDQGEFVTIGERCYEVLKPSFCDMP